MSGWLLVVILIFLLHCLKNKWFGLINGLHVIVTELFINTNFAFVLSVIENIVTCDLYICIIIFCSAQFIIRKF